MKKRVLPIIMLLLITLVCGFITVLAAGSKTQDGISVSIYTDKDNYEKDEEITVDIVITNMNSFDIEDVNVKKILPEGVTLSEGTEMEETIDILYAGEERVLKTTAFVDESFVGSEESSSEAPSEIESEESSSETPSEDESKESSSEAPSEDESKESSSEAPSEDVSEESSSEASSETESEESSSEESSESASEEASSEESSEPASEESSSETSSETESEESSSEESSESASEETSSEESSESASEESSSEESSETASEESSSETSSESASEEASSEASSEPASEESSSETSSKDASVNSSNEVQAEAKSSEQQMVSNESNNEEITTPVMNIIPITDEQAALAEECEEEESYVEESITQSVESESVEIEESIEETIETEPETETVESITSEQESEEASQVVISEEEKILAETVEEEDETSEVNVILFLVIGIGVAGCILVICKKRFGKEGLSILLCVSMLAPMMAQLVVNAEELSQRKTITVTKVIYIDSQEVELQTEISYLLPEENDDNPGAGGADDKEKIVYADGVIVDELKNQYKYELIEGDNGKHTLIIEKNEATQMIKEGAAFVLPANEENLTGVALIAVEIKQKGNEYLEITCEEPSSIGSIIEAIDFEGTSSIVDMNNIEILTEGITIIDESPEVAAYGLRRGVDVYEETIELPDAKEDMKLFADVETPEGISIEGEMTFAIPEVYAKIVGEFSLLDSKLYELEVTVQEECDTNIDVEVNTEILENIEEGLSEATSIPLFKVPVAVGGCGLISAELVITLEIDAKGEAHVEFHIAQEEGVKYNNGRIQSVCRKEEPTIDLEASISGFCGPKVAVNIVILKYCDAFGIDLQSGVSFCYTDAVHTVGERVLTCSDFKANLEMVLELNSDTELVQLLEEVCDTEFSIEIWNEDNSPWNIHRHMENGKIVEECTYKEPKYLDVNNLNQARKDMYKVMDILTDSCWNKEYQPADPYFFWSAIWDYVLYYGEAYGRGEYCAMLVESTKVEKYASGMFEDYVGLLEIPEEYFGIKKLDNGNYSFLPGDRGLEYAEITEWAVLWDGTEVVTIDIIYGEWYDETTYVEEIEGTYVFTLVENPRLQYDNSQIFQYSVRSVERIDK